MPEPPLLLRQVWHEPGLCEEVFRNGGWQPTDLINRWKAGRNNYVEDVTEEQARSLEPISV